MTDRFDRYQQPLTALIEEAIACTPESWSEGWITIECDGSYIHYALKNEHVEDKADISDAFRQRCEALYVVMRESGDVWAKAVVHFFAKDDAWSFEVDFTYPEDAAPISSTSITSVPGGSAPGSRSTPWWKFWN